MKLLKAHRALLHPDPRQVESWTWASADYARLSKGLGWRDWARLDVSSPVSRAARLRVEGADAVPDDPLICALVCLLGGGEYNPQEKHVIAWFEADVALALDAVLSLPRAAALLDEAGLSSPLEWRPFAWSLREAHASHAPERRRDVIRASWERVPEALRWVWALAFPDIPEWAEELVDGWRAEGKLPAYGADFLACVRDEGRARWLISQVSRAEAATFAMDLAMTLGDAAGGLLLEMTSPGDVPSPVLTAMTALKTPEAVAGMVRALAVPKLNKAATKALSKLPALAIPALAADGGAQARGLLATLARKHPKLASASVEVGGEVPGFLQDEVRVTELPRLELAPLTEPHGVDWAPGERARPVWTRPQYRSDFSSDAEHAAWVGWRVASYAAEDLGEAPPSAESYAQAAAVERTSEYWAKAYAPWGDDLAVLDAELAAAAFSTGRHRGNDKHPYDSLIARIEGLAGPGLAARVHEWTLDDAHRWIDRVYHPGMVAGWVRYALKSRKRRARFLDWCRRFSEAAAGGLVPLVFGAPPGKERALVELAVRMLAEEQREVLWFVAEQLGAEVWPALERWLDQEVATSADCPAWLDPGGGPPLRYEGAPLSPAARLRFVEVLAGQPSERRSERVAELAAALDASDCEAWAPWLLDSWVSSGAGMESAWAPAVAAQLGGHRVAEALAAHVSAWASGRRASAANLGVTALGLGEGPAFLAALLSVEEHAAGAVAERARARLDATLPTLGVTRPELRDLAVPPLVFPRSWSLGGRTLEVSLHTDLTLRLTVDGRSVVRMPRVGKRDDPELVATARAEVAALRREVAGLRKRVVGLIEDGWLGGRRWSAAALSRWREHPVLGVAARGLVWTDGTRHGAVDAQWTEAWPAHPVEAGAATLSAMEGLEPVTPQLGRPVYRSRGSVRLTFSPSLHASREAVVGLKRRGWRLRVVDDVHDAVLVWPTLPLPGTDLHLIAELYPGVNVADRSDDRAQHVASLRAVCFLPGGRFAGQQHRELTPVQISEAIYRLRRDLGQL